MFKDYYLVLGIGKDASPSEIEKAFKDVEVKFSGESSSKKFQDVKEAFTILSHQETRLLYDKELLAYNESDDFENYEIKDQRLARTINSLQSNMEESCNTSSGCGSKIGKGCMWAVVIVIVMMLHMCITAIMKQQGRNAVKNRYSYVFPQKPTIISHVCQLL